MGVRGKVRELLTIVHGAAGEQRRRHVRTKRIGVAFALLAAAGCHEDEPTAGEPEGSSGAAEDSADDDSENAEDSSGGEVPSAGPVCVDYGEPCTECEMAACPDLFCDCYGNAECGLIAQCVLACPEDDVTCQAGCAAAFPSGTSTSALLADCAAVNCLDACSALGTIPPPLDACERCVYAECGTQMNACFGVRECPTLIVCVTACGNDLGCQAGCAGLYPAAVAAATTVGDCSVARCNEVCP